MSIKIVGDICIDVKHECDCNRLSPEGPFPILRLKGVTGYQLGMSGYVVKLVQSLTDEVPIHYYGSWGNENDNELGRLLRGKEVDKFLHLKQVQGKNTIRKNRYYVDQHMVARIDSDCYNQVCVDASTLELTEKDILIYSDYNKGTKIDFNLEEAGKVAHSIYDPHMNTNISDILGFTIITPNDLEYNQLTKQANEKGYESIVGYLHDKSPLNRNRYVLHTAGSEGIYLEYINVRKQEIHKKRFKSIGVCKGKVLDIVGAGDCIVSGLAVALHRGRVVHEAITFAMLIAEIAIMSNGTYIVTQEDIKNYVPAV